MVLMYPCTSASETDAACRQQSIYVFIKQFYHAFISLFLLWIISGRAGYLFLKASVGPLTAAQPTDGAVDFFTCVGCILDCDIKSI